MARCAGGLELGEGCRDFSSEKSEVDSFISPQCFMSPVLAAMKH